VEELGLQGKVFVFSISNLTRDNANKLVNPNNPLESVINQSGQQVGYQTLKNAISVLNRNVTPYQFYLVKHQLLTKDDKETIEKLLNETEKDKDLYQNSPVINQQNKPPQNRGVGSTKP
jgi:cell shape-determining protein MreC